MCVLQINTAETLNVNVTTKRWITKNLAELVTRTVLLPLPRPPGLDQIESLHVPLSISSPKTYHTDFFAWNVAIFGIFLVRNDTVFKFEWWNLISKFNFIRDYLCKSNFDNWKFSNHFKKCKVTPVHKNDDPTDKTNFRPVNVLPLSKAFERIIHNQLGKYMDAFLNKLLCGLGKSTLLSMPSLSSCNDGRRNLITLGCWVQYWLTFQKHMAVYLVTLLLLNSRPTV